MKSNFVRFGIICLLPALAIAGCKSKEENKLWPVLSYLHSEAAAMDSSLANIRKVVIHEDGSSDTSFIHRDDFKKEAADFLTLPDISSSKFSGDYKEEEIMDEGIQRFIIRQTPVKPGKQLIQSQEVLIKPSLEGDQVKTVIISTNEDIKDSSVQKKMIWSVGSRFQVTTISQKKQEPEKVATYKIIWAEDE